MFHSSQSADGPQREINTASGHNCIKFVESAFGSMSHVWESDEFVNSVNSTHDKISLGDTFGGKGDTICFSAFGEGKNVYNCNLAGSRCLFPPSINCLNCVVIKPIPSPFPHPGRWNVGLWGGPILPIPPSYLSN